MSSPATTPGVPATCLYYFVHLDENGAPIPGTMFSKNNNRIDHGYACREGRLPPYQVQAPAGHVQCYLPNHLHYYYLQDKVTGRVVPNSLWSQETKVKSFCRGHYNILEYKIWQ